MKIGKVQKKKTEKYMRKIISWCCFSHISMRWLEHRALKRVDKGKRLGHRFCVEAVSKFALQVLQRLPSTTRLHPLTRPWFNNYFSRDFFLCPLPWSPRGIYTVFIDLMLSLYVRVLLPCTITPSRKYRDVTGIVIDGPRKKPRKKLITVRLISLFCHKKRYTSETPLAYNLYLCDWFLDGNFMVTLCKCGTGFNNNFR